MNFLFIKHFRDQIKNESAKLAFFMTENAELKGILLKENLFTSTSGFITRRNSFLFHSVNEALQELISGGIPQHIYKFYMEKFYPEIEEEAKEPQKLTIDDLRYGFTIWLASFPITVLAFFLEFFYKHFTVKILNWIKREIKNLIGLSLMLKFFKK
jgi:hypothetical protein